MDRVSVSEAEGRGFESRRAHQIQTYGHVTLGHKFFWQIFRAHSEPKMCPARAQLVPNILMHINQLKHFEYCSSCLNFV